MFGLITVLYEKKASRYARIRHIKRTLMLKQKCP